MSFPFSAQPVSSKHSVADCADRNRRAVVTLMDPQRPLRFRSLLVVNSASPRLLCGNSPTLQTRLQHLLRSGRAGPRPHRKAALGFRLPARRPESPRLSAAKSSAAPTPFPRTLLAGTRFGSSPGLGATGRMPTATRTTHAPGAESVVPAAAPSSCCFSSRSGIAPSFPVSRCFCPHSRPPGMRQQESGWLGAGVLYLRPIDGLEGLETAGGPPGYPRLREASLFTRVDVRPLSGATSRHKGSSVVRPSGGAGRGPDSSGSEPCRLFSA